MKGRVNFYFADSKNCVRVLPGCRIYEELMFVYIVATLWTLSALFSFLIGFRKGRPYTCLVMGLLLGCLGLLFSYLMDGDDKGDSHA